MGSLGALFAWRFGEFPCEVRRGGSPGAPWRPCWAPRWAPKGARRGSTANLARKSAKPRSSLGQKGEGETALPPGLQTLVGMLIRTRAAYPEVMDSTLPRGGFGRPPAYHIRSAFERFKQRGWRAAPQTYRSHLPTQNAKGKGEGLGSTEPEPAPK